MHVLNVEDDLMQRKLVERCLQLADFSVKSCSTYDEAIWLLDRNRFCVAVIDLRLGQDDGMKLIAEIARRQSKTKIIIHTAYATFGSARDGVDYGVFAYVEKSRGITFLGDQVKRAASVYLQDSLSEVERESRVQIRILDSAQVGAIATNGDFGVVYANSIARELLSLHTMGDDRIDVLELFTRIKPQNNERFSELISSIEMLDCDGKWEGDVHLNVANDRFRKDASALQKLIYRLRIRPIIEPFEKRNGFIFVFTDVSEQRQMELALEQSRQRLNHAQRITTIGQIAHILSHEINQPLCAISNYVGGMLIGLQHNSLPVEAIEENLKRIQDQSVRAGDILRRLRSYVFQRSNPKKVFDINALVCETLEMIEPLLRNHQVKIELKLDSSPLSVEGEWVQLSQVLVNVLKNAAEARDTVLPEARSCEVSTCRCESNVLIRIQDRGPGMEEDTLAMGPEMYMTSKDDGMGLGLSISKSIMAEHGGNLQFENSIDGGLLVSIRLPSASLSGN